MLIENDFFYSETLAHLLELFDKLVYVQVGESAPVLLTKITAQDGNIILMGKEEPCKC
jgi:hypothetical protein